jgi:RimJ/RimL family protein N-acetyltransferase
MTDQALQFTKLRLEDADVLAIWFQDAELQKQMGGCLPLETWLPFACTTDTQLNLLVLEGTAPVGVLTLEPFATSSAFLGVFINPALRERGTGRQIVRAGLERFTWIDRFFADISLTNPRSEACFEACGFTATTDSDDPEMRRFEFARSSPPRDDEIDPEFDQYWLEIIKERRENLRSGKTKGVPFEDVLNKLQGDL